MADVTPCPLCIAEGEQRPGPVRYRGLCGKHLARERRSGTAAAPTREYVRGGTWCTAPHPAGPVKAKARGLCASHYMMARRGEPVLGALKPPGAASCVGPSSDEAVRCGRPVHGGDLCQGHYWQKRAGRDLTPIRERHSPGGTCSACKMQGDDREAVNAGLCYSHYDRKRMDEPDWDRPIKAKAPDGAGHVDTHGYRFIRVDGRSVREHVHVMAQHLGRSLYLGEEVHHMTGGFAGRSDNRLENLELWTKRHPGGHRVEDVARYCREMLAVYGDDGERVAYEPLMPVEQRGALMAKGYDPEVAESETGPADGDEAAA